MMLTITGCSSDDDDTKTVYTVTFDVDGGTPVPSVQKVEAGSTATAPSANPTKTGYAFVYWHLSGASTAYNFQTPVNSNITLIAKWQEEAKVEYWQVTWSLNGGAWPSGDNHATQVVKGGTLAEPAVPVKSDNTFDGWYKEPGLTNKITFPYDVSTVTANFTLYAKWTTEGGGEEPGTYTSISALSAWLASQPDNTAETTYKMALKGVNLDAGSNWTDLGIAIGQVKYVELNLQGCTGTAIPDGRHELTWEGNNPVNNYYGAFVGCRFTAITLPESVKIIGMYAFYNCKRLVQISLPAGLTEIRQGAFGNNQSGIKSALKSISLPAGLKIIGKSAFTSSGLTSITIPGSVKDLEYGTFTGCGSLQSVVLEVGVENIGEQAFWGCYNLKNITLPAGLKTIGKGAFRNGNVFTPWSIPTITIPASVTSIAAEAFYSTSTDEVIMLSTTPPSLGLSAFSSPLVIKVPNANLDAYKTAIGWGDFYASYIVANTN